MKRKNYSCKNQNQQGISAGSLKPDKCALECVASFPYGSWNQEKKVRTRQQLQQKKTNQGKRNRSKCLQEINVDGFYA